MKVDLVTKSEFAELKNEVMNISARQAEILENQRILMGKLDARLSQPKNINFSEVIIYNFILIKKKINIINVKLRI